jgi:predicted lactoylglutathione lyase
MSTWPQAGLSHGNVQRGCLTDYKNVECPKSPADKVTIFRTVIARRELVLGFAVAWFFSLRDGESQTMEQRISVVTLGVKDLGTSRRFYVDGLGWKPVYEDKEIIFFQTGGMVFALFLRDRLAADFHADPTTFGRAAMALAYNVRAKNEVDPLIKRAAAAGATILKPAQEAPWGGYSSYFADPDGFAWEVAWNPAWLLGRDGGVTFR